MEKSFDLILIAIFSLVQWRITQMLWAAAGRRLPRSLLPSARAAIVIFDVLVVAGYACTFPALLSRLGISGRMGLVIGAGALTYLMTATAMMAVHFFVDSFRKLLRADVNPGRRQALNSIGNVLMATPFAVVGYGALVQRDDFRVREVDLPIPGLPDELDGLRILHLSDIHLSAFLSEKELARVIDMSNGMRAHLAVVTGDLISSHSDPLDACIRQVARLKSDAGVFGCLGNHEAYAKAQNLTTQLGARAGVRFLRQQAQPLRFGSATLNLAGVDFQSHNDKDHYLAGAGRMVVPSAVNVLLSHNPDVFPVAANQGYNLLLAGHTHGGQVNVEILDRAITPARFFTPYVYGLYRSGAATAYVTRGIGTIGIPARIGAPPEISVLRLRKA